MAVTPQLRDYQDEIATKVREAYRDGHKCVLVRSDTGTGKTVIFCYITHGASQRGNPVLIAAHRKEIIRQISLSLARFGIEHQVIAPAAKVRQIKVDHFRAFGRSFVVGTSHVMVGSVQTIVTRFDAVDATLAAHERRTGRVGKLLVVMDEGHHVVEGTQWGQVMDRYVRQRGALGLVVTASPKRLDGRGLGDGHGGYADLLIEGPLMSWSITNGYLSPYRVFTVGEQIDLSGVRKRMGEYVASEVQARVDKPSVTGNAIEHWRQHASGMRSVVFCVSITHSEHVAAEFNAAGIPAAHIDGTIDDATRDKAIMDFAEGKILVLTNVNLISEGFDLAAIAQTDVTIDCLIDLAPTESLVNAMQRWGRALRPAPGKTAIFLDHAGNMLRHGLPDDVREWSLEGKPPKKRAPGDDIPEIAITTCPKCFSIHRPAPQCENCGHVYPPRERKVEQKDGELVELSAEQMEAMRRQKMIEQGQAKGVGDLIALGMSKGRALKIVSARDAKERMIEALVNDLTVLRDDHGIGIYKTFDVTISDVRKMKPKQLRELGLRVSSKLAEISAQSVYIVNGGA